MGEESTGLRIKPDQLAQVEAFEEDYPALFEENRSKALRTLIGYGLEARGYEPGIELPNGMAAEAVTDGGFADPSFLASATAVMVLLAAAVNGWAWFVQTDFLTQVGLMFMVLAALTSTLFLGQVLYDHALGRESGA